MNPSSAAWASRFLRPATQPTRLRRYSPPFRSRSGSSSKPARRRFLCSSSTTSRNLQPTRQSDGNRLMARRISKISILCAFAALCASIAACGLGASRPGLLQRPARAGRNASRSRRDDKRLSTVTDQQGLYAVRRSCRRPWKIEIEMSGFSTLDAGNRVARCAAGQMGFETARP